MGGSIQPVERTRSPIGSSSRIPRSLLCRAAGLMVSRYIVASPPFVLDSVYLRSLHSPCDLLRVSFPLLLGYSFLSDMLYTIFSAALLFATTLAVPHRPYRRDAVYYNTTGNRPVNTVEVDQPSPSPKPYGGSHRDNYHSPAWVPHGQLLHPHLPQYKTNGHSKLGTSGAPKLPHFMSGSPTPQGKPWVSSPYAGISSGLLLTVLLMLRVEGLQRIPTSTKTSQTPE